MKKIRIRPAKKLVVYSAVVCTLSLLFPLFGYANQMPDLANAPWIILVVLVGITGLDLLTTLRKPMLAVKRDIPANLSVHVEQQVSMALANRGPRELTVRCIDAIPEQWLSDSLGHHCHLDVAETVEFNYLVTPQVRGFAVIDAIELRVDSSFGFWQTDWWVEYRTEHKVFPNFTAISDLAGLHGSVNLTQAGLKKFNKRGAGMDFLQLRDYREGESIKQIDWRATSRFNKLISREFQEEKNQHVIIMLDAGRRMRVQDDDLSYFDHALNSLIMLSYTALKNGDNLSLQSFGSESRWLSQVKGAQSVSRVMNHFYDLYPQKIASDYLKAAQDLLLKQPKRALILLVTCLRDEDFEDLLVAVDLLKVKHLVAVISVEEPIYKQVADEPVDEFEQALRYASAQRIEQSIHTNIKRLQQRGVMCINGPATHLTPSVLNTYLSVKKAGLL